MLADIFKTNGVSCSWGNSEYIGVYPECRKTTTGRTIICKFPTDQPSPEGSKLYKFHSVWPSSWPTTLLDAFPDSIAEGVRHNEDTILRARFFLRLAKAL